MSNFNLSQYQGIINKSVWQNLLSDYKRQNDKLVELVDQGHLIRLERGKYISSQAWKEGKILKYSIANSLHGPSYISCYTALSYHGLIPEKVLDIESVTIAKSKVVDSQIGRFSYHKVNSESFHIGISYESSGNNGFLIANSAKALIDLIWQINVKGLTSMKSMEYFLFENLRIDDEEFIHLEERTIKDCIIHGKNKRQLEYVLKLITIYRNGFT